MKTKLIFLLSLYLVILLSSSSMYGRDVISANNTYNSYGIPNTNTQVALGSLFVPTATGENIFIKDETEEGSNFTNACKLAAQYLAEIIKDDFPLTVRILYGSSDEFSDANGTVDFLAITTSYYVLNNYENRNTNTKNSYSRKTGQSNYLIPQSIANREFLGDADPETPDITIKLNPKKKSKFYIGLPENIGSNQYDLVTVILRELVVGCGFKSSLLLTNSTDVSYMSLASNSVYYPYLFDSKVVNGRGAQFTSITNHNDALGILSFLFDSNIYFDGNTDYELYNDFITGNDLSLKTLNRTFNPNESSNEKELMTDNFTSGKSSVIRKITPKTAYILQHMGWNIDIITGNTYIGTIVNNNNSGFIIQPGTNYSFTCNINLYDYFLNSFNLVLVRKNGEHYIYKTGYPTLNLLTFTYQTSELPAGEEWQRDPETGHVIGYVKCYGTGISGNINYDVSGFKRVLLPLSPAKANITANKKNETSSTIDIGLKYNAEGATSYKIHYTPYGAGTSQVVQVDSKECVAYTINNLPLNNRYSVYVEAINNSGTINSETVVIGDMYIPTLSMQTTKVGSTLKYRFKLDDEYADNLTISSASIYDYNGNFKMSAPTTVNQFFSIDNLVSGVYILKVEVVGYGSNSKIFMR